MKMCCKIAAPRIFFRVTRKNYRLQYIKQTYFHVIMQTQCILLGNGGIHLNILLKYTYCGVPVLIQPYMDHMVSSVHNAHWLCCQLRYPLIIWLYNCSVFRHYAYNTKPSYKCDQSCLLRTGIECMNEYIWNFTHEYRRTRACKK